MKASNPPRHALRPVAPAGRHQPNIYLARGDFGRCPGPTTIVIYAFPVARADAGVGPRPRRTGPGRADQQQFPGRRRRTGWVIGKCRPPPHRPLLLPARPTQAVANQNGIDGLRPSIPTFLLPLRRQCGVIAPCVQREDFTMSRIICVIGNRAAPARRPCPCCARASACWPAPASAYVLTDTTANRSRRTAPLRDRRRTTRKRSNRHQAAHHGGWVGVIDGGGNRAGCGSPARQPLRRLRDRALPRSPRRPAHHPRRSAETFPAYAPCHGGRPTPGSGTPPTVSVAQLPRRIPRPTPLYLVASLSASKLLLRAD